jgi:hypothetical protein
VAVVFSPAATVTVFFTGSRPGVSTTISLLPGMTGAGSFHPARRHSSPPILSVVLSPAFVTVTVTKPSFGSISLRSLTADSPVFT